MVFNSDLYNELNSLAPQADQVYGKYSKYFKHLSESWKNEMLVEHTLQGDVKRAGASSNVEHWKQFQKVPEDVSLLIARNTPQKRRHRMKSENIEDEEKMDI